jgi:hypothetical protein
MTRPTIEQHTDLSSEVGRHDVLIRQLQGRPIYTAPPRVTTLPSSPADGEEVYWEVSTAGMVGVLSSTVWHMRRNAALGRWEFLGGSPLTFRMEGANAAYVVFSNGTNITVNAAQTTLLQAAFNLPVDTWSDVSFELGNVAKMDAAYHWAQFNMILAGASGSPQSVIRTQHNGVNANENYYLRQLLGGTAGVSWQAYVQASIQGGSWQYNQTAQYLTMNARVWPR